MDWNLRTLAAFWLGTLLTLVCGGRAIAQSHCETERPPNERAFHCIEFGATRFRIPDAYLIVRLYADPKTGRMDKPDTTSAEMREKLGTFAFIARLPDLSPFNRTAYNVQVDLPSQITALVTRKNDWVPPLVERSAGRWVFSERVIASLIAKGYEPRETDDSEVSALQKGPARYRIVRGPAGITEVIYENAGDGMLICSLPYAEGIVVGAMVFKDRDRVCIEGRRVVEKLRSFEY